MATYQYEPLQSSSGPDFRLLELHSGLNIQGQLVCSLIRHPLHDAALTYETISYVWGSSRETATISVDGKFLVVPKSSEEVLRQLVLPNTARTLWIDAVCINQADFAEREQQVQLMKYIYRNSVGNIIYLGAEDSTTARAFQNIAEIHEEIRGETENFSKMWETIVSDGQWAHAKGPSRTKLDTKALIGLFRRPYFSRVWVIQEAILARQNKCICGSLEVPFIQVVRVAVWVFSYRARHTPWEMYASQGLRNGASLWQYMDRVASSISTINALLAGREWHSTDPRDKVFGLLGMMKTASDVVPSLLKPSYTKPVPHVFRDAMRYVLQEMRCLEVLRYLPHRQDSVWAEGFPSWVPLFVEGRNLNDFLLSSGYRDLQPSPNEQFGAIPDSGDENELTLEGIVVDEITKACPSFMDEDVGSVWRTFLAGEECSPDLKRRFARVIIADRNQHGQEATMDDIDMFDDYLAYLDTNPDSKIPVPRDLTDDMPETVRRAAYFSDVAFNVTHPQNTRFAITKNGNMALLPNIAEEGDIITLMDGGEWPFVLRQQGEKWRMIGKCYLENHMYDDEVVGFDVRETTFVIF